MPRLAAQIFPSSGASVIVAGSGFPAYTGDGGLPMLARLFNPNSAAPDVGGLGGLWIADSGNHAIRRVLPYSQCYRMGVVQACGPWYSNGVTWIVCTFTDMSPVPPVYAWLGTIISPNSTCITLVVRAVRPAVNRSAPHWLVRLPCSRRRRRLGATRPLHAPFLSVPMRCTRGRCFG